MKKVVLSVCLAVLVLSFSVAVFAGFFDRVKSLTKVSTVSPNFSAVKKGEVANLRPLFQEWSDDACGKYYFLAFPNPDTMITANECYNNLNKSAGTKDGKPVKFNGAYICALGFVHPSNPCPINSTLRSYFWDNGGSSYWCQRKDAPFLESELTHCGSGFHSVDDAYKKDQAMASQPTVCLSEKSLNSVDQNDCAEGSLNFVKNTCCVEMGWEYRCKADYPYQIPADDMKKACGSGIVHNLINGMYDTCCVTME